MVKLIVDRKIMTWIRTEVEVDATSVIEAIDKYINITLEDCSFISAKEIEGIRRPITVNENNDLATLEIYSPDNLGEIWNNKDGHIKK